MHQHTHRHAFTPILHQCSTIVPAQTMMGTQDRNLNMHLPRPSFAPLTAFHRAKQKSCRSTARGRWGALHVSIAWKIYYHKLKQRQQIPNPGLPDLLHHKESHQPSCMNSYLDSPCGHSAYGNIGDRSKTENIKAQLSHDRSYPSDLHTSSPVSRHSHASRRKKLDWEKLDQVPSLHWKEKLDEKEKPRSCQTDSIKDLPHRDKSWDPRMFPELGGRHSGSFDRKRQLECDSFIKVKKLKQESKDGSSQTLHSEPSPFIRTHTHPSSHAVRVQHMGDLSVLYPGSAACNVSYPPDVKLHPYQTAFWEPTWDIHKSMDLHFKQNVLKDCSLSTCKAIRIPVVAQRQKEAFHSFFTPPLYVPLALRQQETVYLRGRETLTSREVPSPLQTSTSWPSGYILPGAPSHQGPSNQREQTFP